MWMLAGVTLAQEAGGSAFMDHLVNYGIAAPMVALLIWIIYKRDARIEKLEEDHKKALAEQEERFYEALAKKDDELRLEREASREGAERLLDQQKELVPMVLRMKETLKDAADALARGH